jgi:hypothetical protein
MRATPFLVLVLPLCLAAGGCAGPRAHEAEMSLDVLRASTSKYLDVAAALADGYERDAMNICETPAHMGLIQDLGAMGIHYLRRDLLGIAKDQTRLDVTTAHVDFTRPAGLIYEPQSDKSLALVAIENVVSIAAWEAAGHRSAPTFLDSPFRLRPANSGMQTAPQYELQIWLYRDNPSGMFAPYNPAVTCAHHDYNMPMIHPPVDLLPGEKPQTHQH